MIIKIDEIVNLRLTRISDNLSKDIPAEFEGYKVDIEETGEFTSFSKK